MKPDINDALVALKPGAIWTLPNNPTATNDYERLVWQDESQTKPTEDEVNAKIIELTDAEPYRLLRIERNRRLQATDWRASSDLTLSSDWKAHRQDLRDLPSQQTPKLNSDGELDPTSISWPPEPSS